LKSYSKRYFYSKFLLNISVVHVLAKDVNNFKRIKNILTRELCTAYFPEDLWHHIHHLLQVNPEAGVKENLMEICLQRVKIHLGNYNWESMTSLSLMLNCKEGPKRFFILNGIEVFYDMLHPRSPPLDNYEQIMCALKNALKNNQHLVQSCAQYHDFPDIITNLAKVTQSPTIQLICLQLLNFLTNVEIIRRVTAQRCRSEISNLKLLSKESQYYKMSLLCSLNRK